MKVDEAWWNQFIDLAQQREDALGTTAVDSPTAEQLRTLLDMSLEYYSQADPEWWLMKGLPFVSVRAKPRLTSAEVWRPRLQG
jgi:hypothetical protein